MLTAIWNFWTTWSPWIGASLIPTIITGLALAPKLAADASFVQTIWDWVKKAMEVLSVVTHKDQPGTFKMPLKLGKLLTKKTVPPAAILLLAIGLGTHGCSWLSSETKKAGTGLLDCADQTIQSQKGDLVPVLEAAASGSSLESIAVGLLTQFTEGTVACAAKDAKLDLASHLPLGAGSGSPAHLKLNGLTKLIANRKWQYKE